MQNVRIIIVSVFLVGVAALAGTAQDAPGVADTDETGQTPGLELALGQELDNSGAIGSTYTREEFGDWQMRCAVTQDGKDPCQLYQLMRNNQGNPVAEISLFELPPDQPAVAGATIATPLETLLTQQLTLSVDGRNGKRYPFSYCSANGCYSRIGLTLDDIDSFKRGVSATMSIVPVASPERPVLLRLSLAGFTKGFAAVVASNAANREE